MPIYIVFEPDARGLIRQQITSPDPIEVKRMTLLPGCDIMKWHRKFSDPFAFKWKDGTIIPRPRHEYEALVAPRELTRIRQERNAILAETDWRKGDPEWDRYRQNLRDLPDINANPFRIRFPEKPDERKQKTTRGGPK